MKINKTTIHIYFILSAMLVMLAAPLSAASSADELFDKANTELAQDKPDQALKDYLQIADQHGTSPALLENIVVAAEKTNQQGVLEWAKSVKQLRYTEWAIIGMIIAAIGWAALIAFGVWKRWKFKHHALVTVLAGAIIGAGIWVTRTYLPAADEIIITAPNEAVVYISPFEGAEPVAQLPAGTHVKRLAVKVKSETTRDYYRITHPDSQTTGWLRKTDARPLQ